MEGDCLLDTQSHVKLSAADTEGRPFQGKDSDLLRLCVGGKKIITVNETGDGTIGPALSSECFSAPLFMCCFRLQSLVLKNLEPSHTHFECVRTHNS